MKILYFTATGNNLYLAKRIGGQLISIPQAVKNNELYFEDEEIGFIFPIYSQLVPPYVVDFLSNIKLKSNYIFAIMSYGSYGGAATQHLVDVARRQGISFSYINTILMVDNWLPIFRMEKQIKAEPRKQIEDKLESIIQDIREHKIWIKKDLFIGKIMTKNSLKNIKKNRYAKRASEATMGNIDRFYQITENCTQCHICQGVCPTDNIIVNDAKPDFQNRCISCMACIQNCPQNAIRLKGERSEKRFRNQHIKLSEIISANK